MGISIEVIRHAGKYRAKAKEWLEKMSTQVKAGKISKESLDEVVSRFNNVLSEEKDKKLPTQEFIVWLKESCPELSDFYTELSFSAVPYFFDESLQRQGTWLEGLNLDGLELDQFFGHENLSGVDLSRTTLDRVYTKHREIDLTQDTLVIPNMPTWQLSKNDVDTCMGAEKMFEDALRSGSMGRTMPFRALVFHLKDGNGDSQPVALLKFDGETSLVALRTVSDGNRKEFIKGMIYALGKDLYKLLKERLEEIEKSDRPIDRDRIHWWLSIDVHDLYERCQRKEIPFAKNNLRLLSPAVVEDEGR